MPEKSSGWFDPHKPLEVLRRVHSFDPCLACAIHLVDATGREISTVKALSGV